MSHSVTAATFHAVALNNVVKRFDKSRSKIGMGEDEQVLAACMTDPKAAVGAALGGVAGVAIQSAINKKQDGKTPAAEGMAAAWPAGRNLMAITSQRVVVCNMSAMTGKPKEVLAAWPHGDIAAFEIDKKTTSYPFEITFVDGSVARGEGAKGTGADRLGDAATSIWS